MRTIVLIALLIAAPAAAQETPVPVIVTTGEATVERAPDVAYLSIAVETRATQPRMAQQQAADITNAIVKRLTDAGIPKDALRTAGIRVEQQFDFPNGRRESRGFAARNALDIRVDDVARAGELADASVQAGATSVNGIRFDLKDRAAAEREALRLAVADARARADAAAAGVGRAVGAVVKIEEARDSVVSPRMFDMAERVAVKAGAPTPVEPGFIDVRARAVLTVTIK